MSKPRRALSVEDRWTLTWWNVFRADPKRPLRWAQSLKLSIEQLTAAPTTDAAALFWIRLYGVLVEVQRDHKPGDRSPSDDSPSDEDQPGSSLSDEEQHFAAEDAYFADLAAGVFAACRALWSEFTEDELLVIQWKRDDEAHVRLTGYELTERDGKLIHHRDKTIIGRVQYRRVHEAVQAAREGRDDLALAVEFAKRAADGVDKVIVALQEFPP